MATSSLNEKSLFGKRYVFFSSLGNDELPPGKHPYQYAGNKNLYSGALTHFSENSSRIEIQEIYKNNIFFEKFKEIILQLQEIANIERNNEILYLEKTRKKIEEECNNTPDKNTQDELNDILKEFPKPGDENWNYRSIITAFIRIRNNFHTFKKQFQSIYEQLCKQRDKINSNPDFLDQTFEIQPFAFPPTLALNDFD